MSNGVQTVDYRAGPVPVSAVPGIVWPALPNARDASTFALLAQLEMSQWWSPEALLEHQLRQLSCLVDHAAQTVPFYRERLANFAGQDAALTSAEWQTIPVLLRREIQDAGDRLATVRPLDGHDGVRDEFTSGSTGEPVRVQWNSVTDRLHAAFTLRDHLWHGRDFAGKMASVRRQADKVIDVMAAGKAVRWAAAFRSGPVVFFDVTDSVDDALDWLAREDPDYLMTYPTYLRAMIQRSESRGTKLTRLRQVLTFGEVVPDGLRAHCAENWNARLVDMYSTQEVGIIALQCPDHGHYLVQSEGVLLEVLDDAGAPCGPGEVGRVVVTPLHNFATPMIRYFIGDYAEVGTPCTSGRGLPVIRRFYGRSRNMLTLPSGGKIWVAVNDCGLDEIGAVRQFQIVQMANLAIKLKLVVDRPLTSTEETKARRAMVLATGHAFEVHLDYVDSIPRSAGGKLEDVVSEVVD